MINRYQTEINTIWEGDAREVAAQEEPGSFSLAVIDGPYFVSSAACDRGTVWRDALPFFAPHLDDVGRLCAASASLYVWGTSDLWSVLDGEIRRRGWTKRALVTWDKGVAAMAG